MNSKWIKDLNVRPKNIFLKAIGKNIYNVKYGNDFLDITLKIQITKEKIGTLDFMKQKLYASKDNTLHCTPERRNPVPPTKTLTQASLTKKP